MLKQSSTTLNTDTHDKIREICELGYQYFDDGDTKKAIRQFYSAWALLPKPQTDWEQAGWILTALGDVYFSTGNFISGREALNSALHCPKATGNPLIHFRLGQCEFELGAIDNAQQQFKLAKQNGGSHLFTEENAKYLLI